MNSKLTISVLLASYSVTGVPRVQLNIVTCLAARGYAVDLVLITGALPEDERKALSECVRVIEFGKTRVASAFLTLTAYFRKANPKAVISAEQHLNVIAVSALKLSRVNASISISMHVPPSLEASKPIWRKGRWVPILAHWLYPHADAIVAISSKMADSLADVSKISRQSIKVIYNPVVGDVLFKKSEQSPGPLFDKINSPIVLAVGSFHRRKGFLDLVEAFAVLRAKYDLDLVILGEGSLRSELEARIRDLGLIDSVWMPGAVSNPYAWMARARLFVLPSYFEGLPTVLIEAMACGCPVVATDCPTGPSEILQDGRYGELVPMRDPQALAAAMGRTLDCSLDSETLKTRAMDFHDEKIVDQYLDVLGVATQ